MIPQSHHLPTAKYHHFIVNRQAHKPVRDEQGRPLSRKLAQSGEDSLLGGGIQILS